MWDEPTLKLLGTLNRSQQTPADGDSHAEVRPVANLIRQGQTHHYRPEGG
ncbi:MAG: hypothetical protein F6K63_01525 [Moorea sp. SIO1G6]|nr:hypothetical protein [Moorena sp. SIO1G6]